MYYAGHSNMPHHQYYQQTHQMITGSHHHHHHHHQQGLASTGYELMIPHQHSMWHSDLDSDHHDPIYYCQQSNEEVLPRVQAYASWASFGWWFEFEAWREWRGCGDVVFGDFWRCCFIDAFPLTKLWEFFSPRGEGRKCWKKSLGWYILSWV